MFTHLQFPQMCDTSRCREIFKFFTWHIYSTLWTPRTNDLWPGGVTWMTPYSDFDFRPPIHIKHPRPLFAGIEFVVILSIVVVKKASMVVQTKTKATKTM